MQLIHLMEMIMDVCVRHLYNVSIELIKWSKWKTTVMYNAINALAHDDQPGYCYVCGCVRRPQYWTFPSDSQIMMI